MNMYNNNLDNKEMFDFSNLSSSQLLVRKKHLNFDLEEFMNYRTMCGAAVMMITPSQMVMTECFVGSSYDFCAHEDTINAIYSSIYDDIKANHGLHDLLVEDNTIFMLMCRGISSVIIVGAPEVISVNQYNLLEQFNEKIKEIYNNNRKFFDYSPMIFTNYCGKFDVTSNLNNLDNMLLELKNRVGNIDVKKEIILGDSIYKLENKPFSKKRKKYY